MPQQVKCAGCGARYQAADFLAGKIIDCPKCHGRVAVPALKPSGLADTRSSEAAIRFRDDEDGVPSPKAAVPKDTSADDTAAGDEEFDIAPEPVVAKPVAAPSRSSSKLSSSRIVKTIERDEFDIADDMADDADDDVAAVEPPDLGDIIDIKEPPPRIDADDDFHFSIPKLPPVLTHTLLPWLLAVGCLGWAGYITVEHLMDLPGRAVGFSMLGLALLLYGALLVPLTLKSIYSAADTGELRLPNVVWFQTFGLLALPTAGLVVGNDAGGTASMITLGLLGLAAMAVLMAFMYRADVMQTMLIAFYGASAYVASAALCVGILVGVGLILGHAGMVVPWAAAPVVVAQVDKPAEVVAPPPPPTTAPVVEAPKPVEAPVVKATPIVIAPVGPAWLVPVEPVTAAEAWPVEQKEMRASVEVLTPVATSHASGGPFVALLEPKTTEIYDLRSGRRTGFIKAAFQPNNLIISTDGTMLAGAETFDSQGSALFPAAAAPGAVEIWSTTNNQMVGRAPSDATASVPIPLGFAGGKLIASGSSNGMTGLQEWDPASGLILHQWSTPPLTRSQIAISNSGQFVAVNADPVIRIFDMHGGTIAGELSAPLPLRQSKGIAFSPDGKIIAAIQPGDMTGAVGGSTATATLLQWDVAGGGKLLRSVPIDLTAAVLPFNPMVSSASQTAADISYLQWTPDGRMVRIGDGLFEATSGKPVFTLPAAMAGNLSGQLVSVANNRSVFEFMPVGSGSRVVFKTVDLPTATMESTIAAALATTATSQPSQPSLAGATTAPSNATLASATTRPVINAMLLPTPSPVPATEPALPKATVQLAMQRQWDVLVKSISHADPADLDRKLAAQNAAITQLQTQLDAANAKYDQVSQHVDEVEPDGEITHRYQYSEELRTAAHSVVTHIQEQIQEAKINVIKLQKAQTAAPTLRSVVGTLDSGLIVQIVTDSDVSAAFVDAMHEGDRTHVTGFGQVTDGTLIIHLRTAIPLPNK